MRPDTGCAPRPDQEPRPEVWLPAAGSDAPPVSNELIKTLRGIGGFSSGPADVKGTDERLSRINDQLNTGGKAARGLWVWELQLENPNVAEAD